GKDDDGNSIKSGSTNDMSGLSKKQRKARTAFTDHQLQTLEKSFERQKYLSVQERQELAHKLDLSDCQQQLPMQEGVPNMTHLAGLPVAAATTPFSHLTASSSLSSLSNYYQTATGAQAQATSPTTANGQTATTPMGVIKPIATTPSPTPLAESSPLHNQHHQGGHSETRSPSPTLNPGSPPGRSVDSSSQAQSDDEDHIQV
ncbi:hypothetical protein DOY81_009578, partial [Sarcophaga bullata]